jgi:hypothetical protein
MQVLQKAWNLLSDEAKAILRIAEINPDALNTVDLGPKCPFSVGECAPWAQLTGPQFAAQVAAAVSLVEAPANHREATTAAKEIMAIKYMNTTSHSITKFLESPFDGKHPELISKGTKAAAADATVTAAEAIAVADLEEAAPSPWRSLRRPNPGDPCAGSGSHTSGSACRRPARSVERKS